jgi:hypothetical protein
MMGHFHRRRASERMACVLWRLVFNGGSNLLDSSQRRQHAIAEIALVSIATITKHCIKNKILICYN